MQSCARTFAYGIQASDAALSVKVHLDAAAHVVCTWRNGYVVLCYVYAQAQALGIDIWEVLLGFLWVFVRYIQAYMLYAMNLHLVVYGTCHYVAWCQT